MFKDLKSRTKRGAGFGMLIPIAMAQRLNGIAPLAQKAIAFRLNKHTVRSG